MSASRSGSRSNQRSARLRMLSVATWSRSICPSVVMVSGWWWRDGPREREGAADALGRLDPDPSSVLFDDVARDREAEPRAAGPAAEARPVDLVEPLEDPRLGRPRDAGPVIGHGHDDIRLRRLRGDHDLAAVRAELHGVVEEVDDDLPEAILVAADARQVLGDLNMEDDALPFGEQSQPLGRIGRDPADVDLDLVDPVAHPGWDRITRRVRLPGERLGQQADGRQWRPQLVRQVVDELGADLLEAAQLRDVLDDKPQTTRRDAPRAEDEPRAVHAGDQDLLGRRADRKCGPGEGLGVDCDERTDQGSP